jgi:hypothetical protein
LLLLVAVAIAARMAFIGFMPHVYSKDLHAWLRVIDLLQAGGNPYRETSVLNWPPFWMNVLFGIGKLSGWWGVSATVLIQGLLTMAEVVVMAVVWWVSLRLLQKDLFRPLLVGWALNPVCIFLSCQHANFDVFAGLWVLLAAGALLAFYKAGVETYWLAACFCIGMGIFTKTIPFILLPVLLVGIRGVSGIGKLLGGLLVVVPVGIGVATIYTLAPDGVREHVLGYRSMAGWYGITGLFNVLHIYSAIDVYSRLSLYLMLALMVFAGLRLVRCTVLSPVQLLVAMLTMLLFIPCMGPGYSPPYVLWYLPLLLLYYGIAAPATQRLMLVGWGILALTYMAEYALFLSHGAFAAVWIPGTPMLDFCTQIGLSHWQTIVRLPMFVVYMVFFVTLLFARDNKIFLHKEAL